MTEENTKKLLQVAPKLYSGFVPEREKLFLSLSNKATTPFYSIAFGFECGDGWFNLLLKASLALEIHINRLPAEQQQSFYATQVKEKYGTLRFYMSSEDETMSKIIATAESESATTCEVCGKPGELFGTLWLSTVCDEHQPS